MRHTPGFVLSEREEIKRLIRENPWATLVSNTDKGDLVASHYPMILDESPEAEDAIVLLSHVGRPDDRLLELGRHELLVIIQGPHGYISPTWYTELPSVPTWNFVTAHLFGTPEILSDEENLRVLEKLVDHFEHRLPNPYRLADTVADAEYAARTATGTVGFRLTVTRLVAKNKMSQNKPAETIERVIAELEGDGPYASEALAGEMRRVHDLQTHHRPTEDRQAHGRPTDDGLSR